jgi:outer membrane protein TolC
MKQLIFFLSWSITSVFAQDSLVIARLTMTDFLTQVKENHPIAVVTQNNVEMSQRVIQLAKGAFDPKAFAAIDQKYYDGKTYYSTLSSGVKIPTRFGVNFKAMGDFNSGAYLNPENRVPENGLTYLGLEIPLGQGLFTDENRTILKRAEIAFNQSAIQQQLDLNELLFQAGQAFIDWQKNTALLQLAEEGISLAAERLSQIKSNVEVGERAALDSVEANANYLLRKNDLLERQLATKNALRNVELFLWDKGMIPLILDESILPVVLTEMKPTVQLRDSLNAHPIVLSYTNKISDLTVEQRWKRDQLKPQLNFNYNLLQTPDNLISMNYSYLNYKWGASFTMPLFLRKERAGLAISGLKIENTELERTNKEREIATKLSVNLNEWSTYYDQTDVSQEIATNYQTLSAAERELFEIGESSLFLINSREMSYLSAQAKYIESLAKTNKAALKQTYLLGNLGR